MTGLPSYGVGGSTSAPSSVVITMSFTVSLRGRRMRTSSMSPDFVNSPENSVVL
ncbi:unknown [Candidatus Colimorpha enterica]|uniref:Uncharacterized protein n=1 Tax=Candidatus Colimorpha enterica TaxID=3083063 RepID=R6THV2_9BACT|nr:unknown [Candidatus Colimorpha enterica]